MSGGGSSRRLRGVASPASYRQLPSVTQFPPRSSETSVKGMPVDGSSPLRNATTSEFGRAHTTSPSNIRSLAVSRHGIDVDLSDPFTLDPQDPDSVVAGMEDLESREAQLLPAARLVVVDHHAPAATLGLLDQPHHRGDG